MTARQNQLKPVTWKTGLSMLMLTALWGGVVIAVKLGLGTFPPLWSAFWRCLAAAPVIGFWARCEGIRLLPSAEEVGPLGTLAAIMFIQVWLMNSSVNLTSAAYAVILLNTGPLFINLFAHFFVPGDRLTWKRLSGLAMAFAGICVVFLGRPDEQFAPSPILGNILGICAAALLGGRMVATNRLVQRVDTTRAVFWQVVGSMPLFLIAAAILEPVAIRPITWTPVLALLYQGVVPGGLCFIFWVRLLRDHPPGALSVFAFPTPIFGLIFSAIVFAEKLAPPLLLGVSFVVTGIVIVARQPVGPSTQPLPASGKTEQKAA